MTSETLFDFAELSKALDCPQKAGSGGFGSVSIDSRTAEEGCLFVALRGSLLDGHRFVEAAFDRGAAGAMVDAAALRDRTLGLEELSRKTGKPLIVVENTLRGLQDAARLYLEKIPGLIRIGITGSSGKTTTKEIAAAIIGREKKVMMNRGNLNSETGLPLSVFEIRPGHEAAVLEMGMNRRGEIGELAAVFKPHIALITNIGSAHIGILDSRGAIALEKKNIFSCFGGDDIALIPEDEDYRALLAEGLRGKIRFYGPASFEELGAVRDLGLKGTELIWAGETVRFGLPGRHNFRDALGAVAIARELPVSDRAIREGLESVRPLFGRSEVLEGELTVIRDCYNANPESVAEALTFCDHLEWPGRKIYVIGSMRELGRVSRDAHEGLGRLLAASSAEMIFLYGEETEAAAEILKGAGGIPFFHTVEMRELSETLKAFVRPGDLVLLKGSRSCALESLTEILLGTGKKSAETAVEAVPAAKGGS
ncbi:MAG: UDP-N-acetylmuramoyl-tripeptide--D-alanyl-D-alanine ligase [Treponema sp.]|jgi:UDP-N-acetylmuramoyl-tripeptide--D-alanyl-D-alanine ligase|nr:UDP-N-acetylmuramoyl-tripeptide--D-alanyl-D-alanine ligase [Treponema sp.]